MQSNLQNLSEIVAKASDTFAIKFETVGTLMGIMDEGLRAQGMKADAVTIDCIAIDKKIVILLHDDTPDIVSIALGNKQGDIYSSSEYELAELSEAAIVEIMETNFI
ncbi:MAG: hypothetical protein COA90_10855 [Gammaproteobacteria bacterium]|nr:MAG: hypothetical protein COA90_10855 [Gammaproteobacteria bacterium]